MGPLAITLLMAASFAAFAWLTARKLRVVAALQPEVRWDAPLARLSSVLVDGLLQRHMIRGEWRPGVMHTVIFLGFLTLLLRKLQLIAIGYDASYAFTGTLGGAFAAAKDAGLGSLRVSASDPRALEYKPIIKGIGGRVAPPY